MSPRYKSTRVPSCQDSDILRKENIYQCDNGARGREFHCLTLSCDPGRRPHKPQSWRRGSASLTVGRSLLLLQGAFGRRRKRSSIGPHQQPTLPQTTLEQVRSGSPSTSLDRVISTVVSYCSIRARGCCRPSSAIVQRATTRNRPATNHLLPQWYYVILTACAR